MTTQSINNAKHSETGVTYYAVFYRGQYFGNKSHADRTENIEDAMRFTKEDGIKFIKSVMGATLRAIPSTQTA